MNEIIDAVADMGNSLAMAIATEPEVAKRALEVAGTVAATKFIVDGLVKQNAAHMPVLK